MKLFTIGFTKKNASQFFEALRRAGVRRVVDIRLNNTSQLAGFAKRDDLQYFLKSMLGAEYEHSPEFAPTQEILDNLKKREGSWSEYEASFNALLEDRGVVRTLPRTFLDVPTCLLCSEASADHCHRRLVAEAIQVGWPDIEIVHL